MAVASMAVDAATEILMPSSEDEAIAAFGDGADVVVVGGGTIVVPDMTYRRLRPSKALMLGRAGISGITKDGSRVTIGATTPVQDLTGMAAPIGPCASNVADLEIRSQGTVGGNLCAGEGSEAPRGDLQGAFLAVGATARSAAGGDVTEEPLEDFLAKRGERLLLSVSFDEPAAGAFAGLDRPAHARLHGARGVGRTRRGRDTPPRGDGRGLVGGSAPLGRGCGRRPGCRGRGRAQGRHAARRRARLCLVSHEGAPGARTPRPHRAEGVGMNLTVNGIAHEVDGSPLDTAPRRACATSSASPAPKAGCHQGGCGVVHRARRRRAAPLVPPPRRLRRGNADHDRRRARGRRRTSRRSSRRSSTTTPRNAASARRG